MAKFVSREVEKRVILYAVGSNNAHPFRAQIQFWSVSSQCGWHALGESSIENPKNEMLVLTCCGVASGIGGWVGRVSVTQNPSSFTSRWADSMHQNEMQMAISVVTVAMS